MKQYGNWDFFEAYNLPIKLRQWFCEELREYLENKDKK